MHHFDPNAPLSAVDPADIQELWRFMQKVVPGPAGPIDEALNAKAEPLTFGFDTSLVADHCSAGADVNAVFFRTTLIGLLLRMGLLVPWQHDEELSADVFQVAATLPIASLNEFDPNDFLAALGNANDLN